MKAHLPIWHALIVLALLLVASASPAWATSYTITDLGTLGGSMSAANAISNGGQIVGQSTNSAGTYLGFVAHSGSIQSTGSISNESSGSATGVNASGQVVGSDTDKSGLSHAFVAATGGLQQLAGLVGGLGSFANGVNSSGQVAGYAEDALGLKHAVVWVNGSATDMGTLGGFNALAESINDYGHATGYSYISGNAATHAFYWNGSGMEDIGTLGGADSYGYAVNNNNIVVGWSYTSGNTARHAFYWDGTSMHDIGVIAVYSYAYGVNNENQIVGISGGQAFLYSGGAMINLNSVLPANSGWDLIEATAINDAGQIVGYGTINGNEHAFLLTPQTAPTPPAAPTNLTAAGSLGQVTLTWSGSSGATSYNVYRATSSGNESLYQSGVSTTSLSDTAVTGGTTYYYKVTAVDSAGESGRSNEASAAPTVPAATQSVSINCGGGATGSFVGDTSYSGGSTWTSGNSVSTSGVSNAAPAGVYQSQRYGNFSYNVGGLTPGASYTVLLHFAETYIGTNYSGGGAGSREFDVAINGQQVLTNFDIYATAGGANKAVVEQFTATANSTGTISIAFTSVVNNALVEGIQVVPAGTSGGGTTGGGSTSGQTVARVNCGGGSSGSFSADTGYSGGSTWSTGDTITTSGVTNAAPMAVYQSQRYGNFSYNIGGLTPNASYTVRLHFAESYFGSGMPGGGGTGSREFNVTINGQAALTNFDVYANAGANKALVETFTTTASSAGVISLQFTSVVQNAEVNGIEVISN